MAKKVIEQADGTLRETEVVENLDRYYIPAGETVHVPEGHIMRVDGSVGLQLDGVVELDGILIQD